MIENALLKYLGIYPEVVDRMDDIVERICKVHDIDSDEDVWPSVLADFEYSFGFGQSGRGTFTNWLVGSSFRALVRALETHGIDGERVDYCVDGMCSGFYIDGEEQ